MSTIYRLHAEGDCDSYTCPICAQEPEQPEPPILCAHHDTLLDAVRAERPNADLDGLALTFAKDCQRCEVP